VSRRQQRKKQYKKPQAPDKQKLAFVQGYQVAADFLSRAISSAGIALRARDNYLADRSLMIMHVHNGVSRDIFERYVNSIDFSPGKVIDITFADL
jgi:hypothetical protein